MTDTRKTIRAAVVGAGMAGQAHAFGYRNATMAADLADVRVELATIVDPNLELAQTVKNRYGFEKAVADIDEMLADPSIDVVNVALPNNLHAQVLPKVIASGKHLFAEKPIGRTPAEAAELARLAAGSDAVTGVGFSFRRLPGLAAIAQAVAEGQIGEVYSVRAWYYADYAADPQGALSWRYDQELSGGGAVLDIGAHAIDAAQFVAGPIETVLDAQLRTVIAQRPKPAAGGIGHHAAVTDETGPVTNDDVAVITAQFENGAVGTVTLNRIAYGMPNSLGVEVYGTNGHALFDSIAGGQFHVFTADAANPATNGPRRVFTSPAHPYFVDVAPMPGGGVGTGYGEAFVAEVQEFVRCVRDDKPMDTDFATAESMMRIVGAAIAASGS